MIGIDTNALLRWIAPELGSPEQGAKVDAVIRSSREDLLINAVVLAETIWVLARRGREPRDRQALLLRELLDHPRIVLSPRTVIAQALSAFELGGAGFADHLIGAMNAEAGCRTTLTFDKDAAKGPHFTLLE